MFEELVSAIAGYVTEMQTGIAVGETVRGLFPFMQYLSIYNENYELVKTALSVIGFLIICVVLFRVGLALDAASRSKKEERPEFIDL